MLLKMLGQHEHFIKSINTQLKGGTKYPVLTSVLGAAAGLASGGAGLLFTAAMVGIDLASRDSDVLCRTGDEIWHVEEIGKIFEQNTFSPDRYIPTHVSSYLLVDPYRARGNIRNKGWLLHEERKELIL